MENNQMSSLERVLTTLSFNEPDRVPMFLLLSMHGAIELKMSIQDYYSAPENVIKGQQILQKKYKNDCFYNFFYASIEFEAFGGKTIFIKDGPPNAGTPVIRDPKNILDLQPPDISKCEGLQKVLVTHRELKKIATDQIPIIGVVMSPFSLPVMQMGFEKYLDLIFDQPELHKKLLEINESFCIKWANAQLDAGATAICFFDPVSSTTIITKEQYDTVSLPSAKRTISKINGPTATHFASGRCLPIIDLIKQSGTSIIGVSSQEDLFDLKVQTNHKLTLLGNLNGVEMRKWSTQTAENEVKKIIRKAGKGGGLILSDNHGEIPYQVSEEILYAISNAVKKWGQYPLSWIEEENEN